jgi:hypothetical protein
MKKQCHNCPAFHGPDEDGDYPTYCPTCGDCFGNECGDGSEDEE